MHELKQKMYLMVALALMVLLAVGSSARLASAFNVKLDADGYQRNAGSYIRVHMASDDIGGANYMLSMGVKITFDPNLLQAMSTDPGKTDKNTAIWKMEDTASGAVHINPAVEIDNTNGTVTMIGGRINDTGTGDAWSDNVLGWVKFQCNVPAGNTNHVTTTNVSVELGKPHPDFDNFVRQDSAIVDDAPINFTGATICIVDPALGVPACEGDFDQNGNVSPLDFGAFRTSFGSSFGQPNYKAEADFDGNGNVSPLDFGVFRLDFGRTDCPCN